VLAKLEKPEAVAAIEAVVHAFDGVMVARGDLGVELPLDQVRMVQKRAVQLCREEAKPVIVATQMLDSMIENSRPTRAEASDVANAVLDGADAVMLSGETSVGRYPVLAVSTMARIITTTESGSIGVPPLQHAPRTQGGAITAATPAIALAINAKALVAFTQTGDTVRRLARLHCNLPLLAFTPEPAVRAQLSLSWGTESFLVPFVEHTDDMFRQVDQALLGMRLAGRGDLVVIVAGSPPGPVVYAVESVRAGRSFSVRRSVALQHDRPIFFMAASFHRDESGLDHAEPTPPDVPGPDELPTMRERLAPYPERLGIWARV